MGFSYCLISLSAPPLDLSSYFIALKEDYTFLEDLLQLNLDALFSLPLLEVSPTPVSGNAQAFIATVSSVIERLTHHNSQWHDAIDEALYGFFTPRYRAAKTSLRCINHPKPRIPSKQGFCNHCPQQGAICHHFNACQFAYCYTAQAFIHELTQCLEFAKQSSSPQSMLYIDLL